MEAKPSQSETETTPRFCLLFSKLRYLQKENQNKNNNKNIENYKRNKSRSRQNAVTHGPSCIFICIVYQVKQKYFLLIY